MDDLMLRAFMPVTNLSASSVETYLECPKKWRYRYVDKLPDPPGDALVFGRAWHAFWNRCLVLGDIPEGLWQSIWASEVVQAGANMRWTQPQEELLALGVKMSEAAPVQEELAQMLREMDGCKNIAEGFLRAKLDCLPVPMVGYFDFMLQNDEGDIRLYDFKTAARAWSDKDALKKLQTRIYPRLLMEKGVMPKTDPVRFTFVVFTKTTKPSVRRYDVVLPKYAIFGGLDEVLREAWAGMVEGVYPPNTNSWLCNPNYCSFWNACQGNQQAWLIG